MPSTFIVLVIGCILVGVNGSTWSSFDPFEDIFFPSKGDTKSSAGSASNVVINSPSTGAVAAQSTSKDSEVAIRQVVDDEINKLHPPKETDKKNAETAAQPSEATTTENSAVMIRRIVAEELAKALANIQPTTPKVVTTPEVVTSPVPIWKSWANAKYWAKQPGPNGQAPQGFVGSLQSRFGGSDPAIHPSGSPGWVWSKMASKWSTSAPPTIIPPQRIVTNSNWNIVLPPSSST